MTKNLCNQMYIAHFSDNMCISVHTVILKNILEYHFLLKLLSESQNILFHIQWWKIFTLWGRLGFWK